MDNQRIASELLKVAQILVGKQSDNSPQESQKLQLKTLMDTGKETRKEQDRQRQKYISKIGRMLQKLLVQGSKAHKLVNEVVEEFPGKNTGSVATQRKNRWTKLAKQVPEIIKFSEYVGGPKRMYGSALYIVRDVALGLKKLNIGKADAEKIAGKWFMERALQEGAKVFEEGGYEADFMQYLPPNISFDLNPNREVKSIIEMFGREKKNWETFAKKLSFIAMRFNDIVRQVKKDMKSSDDVKRMCALMTAITIETGLRPGAVGNAANVKDPVTGEKIEIETFGVTTLQRRHVKFVRDNFVELRFDGKMGGENVAGLSDGDILKELNKAVESTTLDGDTAMLFVTKKGEVVGYSEMKKYVSDKWGMISPTDFRKLRATKVFYDKIKSRTDEMKKEISSVVVTGKKKMKKIIRDQILEVLQSAAEDAQKELSHDKWKTTIKSYVDPRVVINFLNQGGLDDTLDDILIRNKNVVLTFDFDAFVRSDKVAKPVVVIDDKGESGLSVIDFLDDLDNMVEALTD